MNTETIHIIAGKDSWIEGRALEQVESLARLNGVRKIVAYPDLHPGRGIPVGCITITSGVIYPHIIGNDIGCGMSLYESDTPVRKVNISRLVKTLEKHGLEEAPKSGSIGGGNHFAEFQAVEDVIDAEAFETANLHRNRLFLLVHSGSRSLGQLVYRYFIEKHQAQKGIDADSGPFHEYMEKHGEALEWAQRNRALIAVDLADLADCRISDVPVSELCHNAVEEIVYDNERLFLHRKGAAPARGPLAIIPGSRGDLSWLVRPVNASFLSGWSLPHGAGRKWNRTECRGRLTGKYTKHSITTTALKSRVVCNNTDLLFEEAPEAYKSVETVINAMESEGLIVRVASLRPLVTFKG